MAKLASRYLVQQVSDPLGCLLTKEHIASVPAFRYNSPMNPKAGKKMPNLILAAYLTLAILGSFIFSTGQAVSYEKFNKDILGANNYFSSINHSVDWLAVNTHSINKINRYSNSPLRNIFLRVFVLAEIIGIAMFIAKTNYKSSKNNNFPLIKNLVPLKLRI